jgi:hypothetical protein
MPFNTSREWSKKCGGKDLSHSGRVNCNAGWLRGELQSAEAAAMNCKEQFAESKGLAEDHSKCVQYELPGMTN